MLFCYHPGVASVKLTKFPNFFACRAPIIFLFPRPHKLLIRQWLLHPWNKKSNYYKFIIGIVCDSGKVSTAIFSRVKQNLFWIIVTVGVDYNSSFAVIAISVHVIGESKLVGLKTLSLFLFTSHCEWNPSSGDWKTNSLAGMQRDRTTVAHGLISRATKLAIKCPQKPQEDLWKSQGLQTRGTSTNPPEAWGDI